MAEDFKGYFSGLAPGAADDGKSGDFKGYFAGMSPSGQPPEEESGAVRKAEVAGNAFVGGVQNLVGLPGTLQAGIDNAKSEFKPQNKLEAFLQKADSALTIPGRLPTGEEISKFTGLGGSNNALQPKTRSERLIAAGSEALPDAIAIALTGGGALPALAMTEGGAMAAQTVKEAMPGHPVAPIVAGIVASMGVGGVNGWLQASKAGKLAVETLGNKEELLKDAKSAFSAVVNDASEARDVATAKLATLKSASMARLASVKNFVTNMADQVESTTKGTIDWVAGKLGSSTTPEQVGKTAQNEMRNWVDKTLPAKEAALIKPVNAVMETESLPISGLKAVVESLPKAKVASLKSNLPPDLLDSFVDSVELGTPMTWFEARRLRSEIGAMLKSNKVANDIGDARLEALYSAATKDLSSAAKAKGVGAEFDNYNTEMTKLYNFRDNVANKFITSTNPNAEKVLPGDAAEGFLTRAGTQGTEIGALRQETPKVADELGAYAVRTGQWEKMSPEAKAVLVPDQAQRAALDSSHAAQTQAQENGKSIIAQAETEHKDLMNAAESKRLKEMLAARASTRAAKRGVAGAKEAVETAKAAVPNKQNPVTNLVHQVRGATAGVIGNELLSAVVPALPPGARTALLAAGYLIPAGYRAGKKFLSNPKNLLAPAVGGAEGEQINKIAPSQ